MGPGYSSGQAFFGFLGDPIFILSPSCGTNHLFVVDGNMKTVDRVSGSFLVLSISFGNSISFVLQYLFCYSVFFYLVSHLVTVFLLVLKSLCY